jgi:hypothetical protein
MMDFEKSRREAVRWLILLTLNAARPVGANELIVVDCVRQAQPDVTPRECAWRWITSRSAGSSRSPAATAPPGSESSREPGSMSSSTPSIAIPASPALPSTGRDATMPKRTKVKQLPKAVKAWLDRALADNGFSQYESLAAALGKKGFAISKSSLHRYGRQFERASSRSAPPPRWRRSSSRRTPTTTTARTRR